MSTATKQHLDFGLAVFTLFAISACFDQRTSGKQNAPTGEWKYDSGSRICDGYLTRKEGENSCSSSIPDDWVPYEFNGEIYYSQPLEIPPTSD